MKDKFLQFLYSKLGWMSLNLAKLVGPLLIAKGLMDDPATAAVEAAVSMEMVTGAIATILGLIFSAVVKANESEVVRNVQVSRGLKLDRVPGPQTLRASRV